MMNLTSVKNPQERFTTAVSRLSADAKTTAAVGFPGEHSGGDTSAVEVLLHWGLCWEMVGYGIGSKPITINFSGMNTHLPATLGFTRCQGFDP